MSDSSLFHENMSIGLFGLGKSNLGVLEYLKKELRDFRLTLRSDVITEKNVINADRAFLGEGAADDIDEDIIFLSPTVRRDRPALVRAMARGTRISSDAELFFESSGGNHIAVTGSDGKSSTTYLISSMLSESGIESCPAGNYGKSLSSLIGASGTVAAELSSFQLMYMKPKTRRAVITNLTPNHLNWHESFDEYAEAKANIIPNTGGLTVDYDSELLRSILPDKKIFAAVSAERDYKSLSSVIEAENYLTLKNGIVYLNGLAYFDTSDALRREAYNLKNYMLASGAVIGIASEAAVERAVKRFGGLSHRADTVCVRHGIKFVDSSIDSSPERTLKTLSELEGEVAVIIGGKGKGLSLDSLAKALPTLSVGAVLTGEVGKELSFLLSPNEDYPFAFADNMKDAIRRAELMLPRGGTVILSPAATSFDRYKNFEERGDDFRAIVLSE